MYTPHLENVAAHRVDRARVWRRTLAGLLVVSQVLLGLPLLPGLSAQALAQVPRPRVWIAPMQTDGAPGLGLMSEKFDEAVRQQLSKSNQLVLTEQDRGERVMAGESDPRVSRAENLRTTAKQSFKAGQYEEAQKQLRAALELYEEGLASVRSVGVIAETLGFLGASAVQLGFDADAEDYFERVVAMMPDATPLDEYNDKTRKIFEKVRKKAMRKKPGSLQVQTEPAGAQVRINGVDRGAAPVKVPGLLRGIHYVQAGDARVGLAGERVRVRGGKEQTLTLTLEMMVGPKAAQAADPTVVATLLRHAREGQLEQNFRDQAEAIAAQTRAEYIVAGVIEAQDSGFVLRPYLYGVQQKQTAALDTVSFRADLASVFVQAANFSAAVEAAVSKFPFDQIVTGPIVVAAAVPAPTPAAPAPTPAAPAPTPAAPAPTPAAPVPTPAAPAPTPAAPAPAPRPVPPAVQAAMQPAPAAPQSASGGDEDEAWYQKWYIWTAAGVVLAGGAVAAGYLLSKDASPPSKALETSIRW